jgi:hypothetical protein
MDGTVTEGNSVPTKLSLTMLAVLLLVLGPAPTVGVAQSGGVARSGPRNVRGIHTLAASSKAIDEQLRWAANLVGPGGAVTQPFLGIDAQTAGPSSDAVAYVEQAYEHQLDPILVLQGRYVNRDGCNASGYVGWLAPVPDGPASPANADGQGGTYRQEAEGYRRFVEGLPRVDGRTLSVQIGNEPNLHEMWGGAADPGQYARFFADVSAAIHAIGDPRIRVLNAALAPEGNVDNLQFIAEAIQADPRFASAFDEWASHPYPRNRPPWSNLHDGTASPDSRYTIDSYLLELDALRAGGVNPTDLKVVLTETGYELGDRRHAAYPVISEQLRAAYMAEAFEQWSRWPEIRVVTPFELAGWYGSWRSFDWVWPSSETTSHGLPTQPRPQYARLLPGLGTVTGVARDDRGTPLQDVAVVSEPDGYRASTLADGTFIMLARPGRYTLAAEKDGHAAANLGGVPVIAGASTSLDLTLPAQLTTTLRNASFEQADLAGWTTWGSVDEAQAGPWFFGITAHDGDRFLGTAVNCGAKDGGAQQTVSAQPGSTVLVGAWTLTYRDGQAHIGNRIGIDPWGGNDPRAERIVWSEQLETGGSWQRLDITARAESDRVTIFLEHDQDAANPWNVSAFDGVVIHQDP